MQLLSALQVVMDECRYWHFWPQPDEAAVVHCGSAEQLLPERYVHLRPQLAVTELHLHMVLVVHCTCEPTVVQAASHTPRLMSKLQALSLLQAVAEVPYLVRQVAAQEPWVMSHVHAKGMALHSDCVLRAHFSLHVDVELSHMQRPLPRQPDCVLYA